MLLTMQFTAVRYGNGGGVSVDVLGKTKERKGRCGEEEIPWGRD